MVTKRAMPWFLTERGRTFSFYTLAGAGITLTFAKFLPHSIGLQKYVDYVRYYINGKPAEVPVELDKLYQECLDTLKFNELHRRLVTPFSVFGFDLFHAGGCNSKYGAAIGIPKNFTYKSLADVERDDIMVNQKKVDFTSEVGEKLGNALILSERAQKFALCRELLMVRNNKFLIESSYPIACTLLLYAICNSLNTRLNLYIAPTFVRITLYSIAGSFVLGIYFLAKDMTEVHYEMETDKQLCELGQEYIESGVEFYDKILQRNRALRELMGREGENKYSKLGNENFFIRQPRTSLVHRKLFFENKLKECVNKDVDEIEDKVE